jgi:DNA topoisomerase-2
VEKLAKKHKKANVKPAMVKNHLWVFVNTQIENPAFSSQVCVRWSGRGRRCRRLPLAARFA